MDLFNIIDILINGYGDGEVIMAIPIMALMAGANMLKSGYDLWQAKKNPMKAQQYKLSPEEQAYNAEIARRAEEGSFDVSALTGKDTRRIESSAGNIRAQNTGNIISQGLEDSMMSTLVNKDVNANALKQIRESSEYWNQKNEQSKLTAGDQLGQIGQRRSNIDFQNNQLTYQAEMQNRTNVSDAIGGLIKGGVGIYQGFDNSALEKINFLMKSGRPGDIEKAIALLDKR